MNIKLNENLGVRTLQVFLDAEHDVQTVRDEQLQGQPDEVLYHVCRIERRCLVTLDMDFSNVLRFPPGPTAGIAVLKPRREISLTLLVSLAQRLVALLATRPITGQLWIIETDRIRVHQSTLEDAP